MSKIKNVKSIELFKRASKVIPTGIPGHLGPVQSQFIPTSDFPFYADRVQDSYFWDIDGNRYIDYMCAYGPNVLGYNNEVVDKAAQEQRKKGDTMALPGKVQVEFAELLVDTLADADWAFFLKNGNDATTFATMAARAATGRNKIIRIEGGYHGVTPWTQKRGAAGVLDSDIVHNLMVPWNDVQAVQKAVAENQNEIAAFIGTPYDHRIFADNELPHEGYWQEIRKICDSHGIILIIDDVRCGFRLDLAGSARYFGFSADLTCYCKALANGYNISAVVGKDFLKKAAGNVFYTGSYWSSAVPMAAGIATVKELIRVDGANLMLRQGEQLIAGITEKAKNHKIDLKFSGAASMFYMRITNDDSLEMQQQFCAECVKRGVFFVSHHNHFTNCALTDADIQQTIDVADEALAVVAKNNPEKLSTN